MLNEILTFGQQNGMSVLLWLIGALGIWFIFGKNLGHAFHVLIHGAEDFIVKSIPIKEVQESAKILCRQADDWSIGADGESKFNWALNALCLKYKLLSGILRPILQGAYEEYKKELIAEQSVKA